MEPLMGIIALLTDFGSADWYAGEMKAALLSRNLSTTLVDITHEVPPGDIRFGGFVLRACYTSFPASTVFCAVVDPGVGSARAALAIRTSRYFFVGPDNGILSWAAGNDRILQIIELRRGQFTTNESSTFHGRDLFGPAAALIASGTDVATLGPVINTMVQLEWPAPAFVHDHIEAPVMYIDRFGNAITSIDTEALNLLNHPPSHAVHVKSRQEFPSASYFQQVTTGSPLCYMGSSGFLELGSNGESAATCFSIKTGNIIAVY
jgi:S-adenosyl-L-methionine hydrolase (adenosine-forming)